MARVLSIRLNAQGRPNVFCPVPFPALIACFCRDPYSHLQTWPVSPRFGAGAPAVPHSLHVSRARIAPRCRTRPGLQIRLP